jgi:AraC-like DNA-binding protein
MIQYSTISIPVRLRSFIRRIWILDPDRPEIFPGHFSIYADGFPGIIFQQSESNLILNGEKKLPGIFLYGQTVQPISIQTAGRLKMIIVCFHPHVLFSVFRFNARTITDDCLDLGLLPPVPGINLEDQLWNTVSAEKRVSVLFDYIEQLIIRNRSAVDAGMAYATSQLLQHNSASPLKELQRVLNLSERTFQRKFEQYIGVPPKLFSKISQFQAALSQLRSGRFNKLSDIAYDNGFADQSHFIRNFKKFTGFSPLELKKQAESLHGDFPGLLR